VPTNRVNDAGVRRARRLIDAGTVDVDTEWSHAAPSAARENDHIEGHGHDRYGEWHLAVDPDASAFGDFTTVNRAALVHAKQRAARNDHPEIAEAADALLHRLDDRQQ
jgi:hypothetical protein